MAVIISLASYISILITAISLAWGYSEIGFNPFVRWILFFGIIWLIARSQLWWWFSGLAFIATILAAAFGILFGTVPGWMISSGVFALIAWDLTEFHRRTRYETRNDELRHMEQRRLARLTLLALTGLLVASITMFLIRAPFTIEWAMLCTIIFFLGLLQLVLWFSNR